MNFSDSERIKTLLEDARLKSAKLINQADLVIFTTCGVRQTAEDRVYGQVHNLRKSNPEVIIVITGCLANRKDVQRKLKDKADFFISIKNIQSLIQKLREKFPNKFKSTSKKIGVDCESDYLEILPKYKKPGSVFVPIMTGCNNFCSYCVVPYARGREKSRPIQEIVDEIKKVQKGGCKEALLLGQNVNSYCHTQDRKLVTFPVLLELLAKSFPTIKFSFLTSHPKDFSDELIEVIEKHDNISKNIHLPLQSGSNKILRAMNRKYTKKHYLGIISKIRKVAPEALISTDIIIGFPGETEKEFQKTVDAFQRAKFSEAFLNKYSPRPGTAAEKLGDPISWEKKKRREKVLRKLL